MRLHHLSLTNFRNYARLEIDFPGRLTLLQGGNAQGKSSLLEAIHYLATGRAPQAEIERELVNWLALDDPIPYARVTAEITHDRQAKRIEITLLPTNGPGQTSSFRKQVRINGVARRALDLVGALRVVLFMPQDLELVDGAPTRRRRYLDVALCQMNAAYCRSLAAYNHVLTQRNALLRTLRERGGDAQQLQFWDEQLTEKGALLIVERHTFVANLDTEARARHRDLTEGREQLQLQYLPSFDPSRQGKTQAQLPLAVDPDAAPLATPAVHDSFVNFLAANRRRDIAAGTTVAGPHRDDLRFVVGGHDLRTYGSRGQQRTAALALKLAEVEVMMCATGEPPLLLLDDVMSELDASRRQMLVHALDGVAQAIVTTTDWDDFTPALRAQARLLQVTAGQIEEAHPHSAGEMP